MVGEVVRPHGVRGEVVVRVHSETAGRFDAGVTLLGGESPERVAPLRVEAARAHRGGLIARFGGVADRNQAEDLRGMLLFVKASEVPAAEPGAYWLHQITGLAVVDVSGRRLGVVAAVRPGGEQDLWEVATEAGPVLLPAVSQIVREVDLDAGTVVVDPPPGLFPGPSG